MEHRDVLLKNFLQLVLLLDRTMSDPEVKLPKGSPPLFCPNARLKSSKQVGEVSPLVCVCVCVLVCACVRACVRACVCVCACLQMDRL